jgi:fumarylacetoacetase
VATSDLPVGGFSLANLPFGVVRPRLGEPRVVVRVGDAVLDLAAAGIAPELTSRPTANALFAARSWSEVRRRAQDLLADRGGAAPLLDLADVEVLLPIDVGDFVDFYSSIDHATNLGRILRPGSEPLLANWRRLPVGYHGRASSVVVSGTPIARPEGLITCDDGRVALRPTGALDFELEVGWIVGGPPATRLQPDHADRHVVGAVLLNDWSARDIQSFEYQPLGPNLAKSFATSISPWIVTLDALRPFLVAPPEQDPPPDPYLRARRPWAVDLDLQVELNATTITRTNFAAMYWSFAQQLAHTTVNGATTRAGDLLGSGTVSGPTPGERGSMIELTWRGAEPLTLAGGATRSFLEDGDTVTMRGWCGDASVQRPLISFGEVSGTIMPAPPRRRPESTGRRS